MRHIPTTKSRPAVAALVALTILALFSAVLVAGPAMDYLAGKLF